MTVFDLPLLFQLFTRTKSEKMPNFLKWPCLPSPKIVLALAAAVILGSAAGCADRNSAPLLKVRGTVKYRGKLLDHGRVIFLPTPGVPGLPALGEIRPDGTYILQTGDKDGAAQGKYRVLIQCRKAGPSSERAKPVLPPSQIPEKYSDENASPISIEVKPGVEEYPIVLE
jgi:hypothetical protein